MPQVRCGCGNTFSAPEGDASCPACGARLAAPGRLRSKAVKCPKCASPVRIPPVEPELDLAPEAPESAAAPQAPPAAAVFAAPPPPEGWRKFGRWALALALVPLILSVFSDPEKAGVRLERMVERDPSLKEGVKKAKSEDEFFAALPDGRIEGAFLSHETWTHWLFALLAAGAFWGFILLVYPLGTATSRQLWITGVFTGTIGILLLLAVQWLAGMTEGVMVRGRGIGTLLFYIVKLIGFSYRAALDPENGFLLSFFGFTVGVGLCEELCKALPLIAHYRGKATLDLRGAAAVGLATGIGFGVSEGITYSSDFYNGVWGGEVYVVRFVSCVALHAVWSASNAILLWRRQNDLQSVEAWYEWFVPVLKVLGISMVLHGLYDTLLKKDMELPALLAALASFAWFFWLYERLSREPDASPAPVRA